MKLPIPANSRRFFRLTHLTATQQNLAVISLIMVINAIAYGTIIPLLYPFATRFGLGTIGLSLLFASFSLSQMIATPILGRLSDRYGRKPVLLWCIVGSAVSSP
jgi:MFS family permease